MISASSRVARLAWATLVANLFVILWGAWVRASGSGAGCGNHWPTCNGVIIPESPTMHTIVEFAHRLSSGVALLLVVALVVESRRRFAGGHPCRRAAVASFVLICIEAGLGAGLVKFGLVAANATLQRALVLGIHLVNTQFLLTAIMLCGWYASGRTPLAVRRYAKYWVPAFGALIVVGMAGAAASLGDTLFPARSLTEGLAQDRGATVNALLHIRVWHPLLAVAAGIGLLYFATVARQWRESPDVRRAARAVVVAVLMQWVIGVLSIVLLVPVALQLLHLLTADLLWLAAVWLVVALSSDQVGRTTRETSATMLPSSDAPASATR